VVDVSQTFVNLKPQQRNCRITAIRHLCAFQGAYTPGVLGAIAHTQ